VGILTRKNVLLGHKYAIIGAVIGGGVNITVMIYVVLLGPTLVHAVSFFLDRCIQFNVAVDLLTTPMVSTWGAGPLRRPLLFYGT